MAFSGDQPNFKQLDLSVETGTGTNAASGSIMFHATSGLIQHINGDWATMSSSTTPCSISDVQIAGAASGQLIRFDGSQWSLQTTTWRPSLTLTPPPALVQLITY